MSRQDAGAPGNAAVTARMMEASWKDDEGGDAWEGFRMSRQDAGAPGNAAVTARMMGLLGRTMRVEMVGKGFE